MENINESIGGIDTNALECRLPLLDLFWKILLYTKLWKPMILNNMMQRLQIFMVGTPNISGSFVHSAAWLMMTITF